MGHIHIYVEYRQEVSGRTDHKVIKKGLLEKGMKIQGRFHNRAFILF